MSRINVIKGVKYTPDMFLQRIGKYKKMGDVVCTYANTVYSPCWIFQFRIELQITKSTKRYAGYYAGYDEVVMTPGKLAMLPSAEEQDVPDACVLASKLTEEQALAQAWEYNKQGIIRKFRQLNAPPVLAEHRTEFFYKPLHVFEFYHPGLNQKKYKVLDSLTGDLMDIHIF